MTEPRLLLVLEAATWWALSMSLFSGVVLGAAGAAIVLGRLSCGG